MFSQKDRRKTKIIATVGPACDGITRLRALIREGVDVFRINASHTSEEGLKSWIRLIRKAAESMHKPVSVLVDLQGPRVRTGSLKEKKVLLKRGDRIELVPGVKTGTGSRIATPCRQLPAMVKEGHRVLLDNGLIELKVLKNSRESVVCSVINGGVLGENKGINIPSAPITLPALTAKDKKDLAVALKMNVDFIALSFVRSAKDIADVKRYMKRHRKQIPIIAKIEKPSAVEHFDAIVEEAAGIMVARGDLGIEKGVEKVPVVQKQLIERSNQLCIPVITATQMLESMIENSHPTRAEASDVANAVFDGTDAVMLSGETAVGKYPLECVRMMSDIIREAEKAIQPDSPHALLHEAYEHEDTVVHALTHAARHAANAMEAKALLVFTRSGKTAVMLSKFRPEAPIIAMPHTERVVRFLTLFRGIQAMRIAHVEDANRMLREADRAVVKQKLLKRGDMVVVVSGRHALPGFRFMTKIHPIGEH